jgi:hypothetical protein
MREISPESDVRKTEFTGETGETYWKNIFDFRCLKTSKKKNFTETIETDGVAMCVHHRRLKADRPVPLSTSPSAKHEHE